MNDKKIPATTFPEPGRCKWHHLRRVFDLTSGGWRCGRCLADGEPPRRSAVSETMAHQMHVLGIRLDSPEVELEKAPTPPTDDEALRLALAFLATVPDAPGPEIREAAGLDDGPEFRALWAALTRRPGALVEIAPGEPRAAQTALVRWRLTPAGRAVLSTLAAA